MATDYDTPRKTDDELGEDSIEELKARRVDKSSSAVDVDETELAESLELPGADLSNEELSVRVLPRQADEFTCSRCFLVHHRSQLAREDGNWHIACLAVGEGWSIGVMARYPSSLGKDYGARTCREVTKQLLTTR